MSANFPEDSEKMRVHPRVENLGRNCKWWGLRALVGCDYPKAEIEGRMSCEGMIDDVCLEILTGRKASSLTDDQRQVLRTRPPDPYDKSHIPPGEII
ncbi:MAG: hypothetical protein QG632_911 [Candidatus Dependentiae bacterium]|jgi:hypothetical protein|nr:hypothetical protein [Candidatus Dependentiae bacterium]